MTNSPEAVQAALDAFRAEALVVHGMDYAWHANNELRDRPMQAALEAAFPIMLRDEADQLSTDNSPAHYWLRDLADSYGKKGG